MQPHLFAKLEHLPSVLNAHLKPTIEEEEALGKRSKLFREFEQLREKKPVAALELGGQMKMKAKGLELEEWQVFHSYIQRFIRNEPTADWLSYIEQPRGPLNPSAEMEALYDVEVCEADVIRAKERVANLDRAHAQIKDMADPILEDFKRKKEAGQQELEKGAEPRHDVDNEPITPYKPISRNDPAAIASLSPNAATTSGSAHRITSRRKSLLGSLSSPFKSKKQ
ncbi:hypothetical protein JCM10207_008055 [Rhodosporidiobolus poonsookiae]